MSFDVASVKPNPPGTMINLVNPNMPLDSGDAYPGNTTLFSANMPAFFYIAFAYKLPSYQINSLISQLPKWGKWTGQGFNIQARAASPATKDQMRLMMQSLLADRFKLAIHWEKRQVPSYDLVAIKPGKTGPQMQPHDDKTPCKPYAPPSGDPSIPGQLPAYCGGLVGGGGPGGIDMSGRDVTAAQLADWISEKVQRPVIDKTGFSGGFDITLNTRFHMTPDELKQFGIGDIRAAYLEAIRDQLGLKLESSNASADFLIVDRIEEPSPN